MKYDKLVRDGILDIILKSGKKPTYKFVKGDELMSYLSKKIGEEADEYQKSRALLELADLIEVIMAIADYEGLSWEQLMAMRERKKKTRGGFEKGIVLQDISE